MRDGQAAIDYDTFDLTKEMTTEEVVKVFAASVPVEYRNRYHDALEIRHAEIKAATDACDAALGREDIEVEPSLSNASMAALRRLKQSRSTDALLDSDRRNLEAEEQYDRGRQFGSVA